VVVLRALLKTANRSSDALRAPSLLQAVTRKRSWLLVERRPPWFPASCTGDRVASVAEDCKPKGGRASRAFTTAGGHPEAYVVAG